LYFVINVDLQAQFRYHFSIFFAGVFKFDGFKYVYRLFSLCLPQTPKTIPIVEVVTPLKDRIDSQIVTHDCIEVVEIGRKITEREAKVKKKVRILRRCIEETSLSKLRGSPQKQAGGF
jgi:hypothetical protein